MNKILSPITLSDDVTLIRKINVKDIIKLYKSFEINVSENFNSLTEVSIFQCNQTGYKFYYPFNMGGGNLFYQHFQNFDWYYMPWKWEHEIAKSYIRSGMNLLEVGCANGAFLKRINEMYSLNNSIGLELNESTQIQNESWQIINANVEEYSINHQNEFDIVCSFQVLEHIAEIKSFIDGNIKCLKPGGKLIISVPNNNSFLQSLEAPLNMPPHHMGLWTEDSLKALTDFFPLKVLNVHLETLNEYHVDNYLSSIRYNSSNEIYNFMVRKFDRLTGKYKRLKLKINDNKDSIIGHTILIVYEKLKA